MLDGITVLETYPITGTSIWGLIIALFAIICVFVGATIASNYTIGNYILIIGCIAFIVAIIGMLTFLDIPTGRNKYTVQFDKPYTAAELYDAGYQIEEHLPYSEVYIIKEIETK